MPWERLLMGIIEVIRKEQRERMSALALDCNDPDSADYQNAAANAHANSIWEDRPIINELCMMLLVTLWHHVQHELILLAAKATGKRAEDLSDGPWREVMEMLRLPNQPQKKKGAKLATEEERKEADEELRKQSEEWEKQRREAWFKPIEILRLLANSYKHEPSRRPSKKLKDFLKLPAVPYQLMGQSYLFQEILASEVSLNKSADYCEIAERFVVVTSEFLSTVEKRIKLPEFDPSKVIRVNPLDLEH